MTAAASVTAPQLPSAPVGPPAALPLMCYPCLVGACAHRDRLSSAHGGGLVPAITTFHGTAFCLDCAQRAE